MFVARSIAADHKDLIHDVSFDFHGRRMATCSSDQSVKVRAARPAARGPARRGREAAREGPAPTEARATRGSADAAAPEAAGGLPAGGLWGHGRPPALAALPLLPRLRRTAPGLGVPPSAGALRGLREWVVVGRGCGHDNAPVCVDGGFLWACLCLGSVARCAVGLACAPWPRTHGVPMKGRHKSVTSFTFVFRDCRRL